MKPLIGINLDVEAGPPVAASVQSTYYEAIQKAGGIPVLLPPMSEEDLDIVLKKLSGLMLIGGRDYCPSFYNEDRHEKTELAHPERLRFDLQLIDKAIRNSQMPILGICAGHQLLNIGLKGSLFQDIETTHPHSNVVHTSKNGWSDGFTRHRVKVEPGTILAGLYNTSEFEVPTSHHQAIKELGEGLLVSAVAEDGIVEAVEMKERPFTVGVQWHPERDFEGNKKLFVEFVKRSAQLTAV